MTTQLSEVLEQVGVLSTDKRKLSEQLADLIGNYKACKAELHDAQEELAEARKRKEVRAALRYSYCATIRTAERPP